jgi:hypothetical protein
MSASNRAALIDKIIKVAKKNFQPVAPPEDRVVLEHMLYACVLEDNGFDEADEAFAKLQQDFYDWNEIRVTTVQELAEVMNKLTDPSLSATRLKKTLHSAFETHYSFDLEFLKKDKLSKAVDRLHKYKGISSFVIGYVAQNGLAGHSIPVDKAFLELAFYVGLITQKEFDHRTVPGLERAIPKNKGVEAFSLMHQFAAMLHKSPYNPDLRKLVLSIEKSASDRLPKRGRKKDSPPTETADPNRTSKKEAAKRAAARVAAKKKVALEASKSKSKKSEPVEPETKKPSVKKSTGKKTGTKKKGSVSKKSTKSTAAASEDNGSDASTSRKSPTKRLAKKKPR